MGIIKPIGSLDKSLDKSQITGLATEHAQAVIDSGRFDMLKVYTELKRYELYLKTVIENTKEAALAKALEAGEKSIEMDNARVTISKRTVFHFENDPKWQTLNDEISFFKDRKKERETLLKNLAPGEIHQIVDEATGEVEEVTAPPVETVLGLIVNL